MSNLPDPYQAANSPTPGPQRSCFGCLFALSFLLNILAGGLVLAACFGLFRGVSEDSTGLYEKLYSGSKSASDKVAVVTIDGILLESFLGHAHKQLEQAAKDEHVKAVVLRINSPGGSVTASEDLHQRIVRLRDGDKEKNTPAKPVVASMGGVAASGGYYIAAPASRILAETTTTTGSIGVFVTVPNVSDLTAKYGVAVNIVKAGDLKASGSLFQKLTDRDRQVIQDMVDEGYVRFLQVVENGRKKLSRKKMLERFRVTPLRPDPQAEEKPAAPYTRYRADGGTFGAARAKELDLVDAIGGLDAAVKAAAAAANLTTYRAVQYQKPFSFTDRFLGVGATATPGVLDPGKLEAALSPRLWYLAPGYEAAGLLAASRPSR
jgi:protease-4